MNSKVSIAAIVLVVAAVLCVSAYIVLSDPGSENVDGATLVRSTFYSYDMDSDGDVSVDTRYNFTFNVNDVSTDEKEVVVTVSDNGRRYSSVTTVEKTSDTRCIALFDFAPYGFLATYSSSDGAWYIACDTASTVNSGITLDSESGHMFALGRNTDIVQLVSDTVISFYNSMMIGAFLLEPSDLFGGELSETEQYILKLRGDVLLEPRSYIMDESGMHNLYIDTGSSTILSDDTSILNSANIRSGTVIVKTTKTFNGQLTDCYEYRQYVEGEISEVRTYDSDMSMVLSIEYLDEGSLWTIMSVTSIS